MASVGDRSENSMDKKILQPGAVISCKTQLGEEFSGEVMAFDEDSKALVIKSFIPGRPKAVFDVAVVNLGLVDNSNFKIISAPKGDPPRLPEIDKSKIKQRLKQAKERVGIGVSAEAQQLFDYLSKKVHDVHWQNKNILVFDEVHISPPYNVENCSGEKLTSVSQVKKMV